MLLYLPHAVPGIIAAVIWLYLYTPGLSPVIKLFAQADITIDFLGCTPCSRRSSTSPCGAASATTWSSSTPRSRRCRARCSRRRRSTAREVRTALQVKVPIIRGSVVMVCVFSLIGALQLFTEPMLMNQATPMVNSRFTPNMYIYDAAFRRNNYGLASAASVILLVVTCALSYAVTRWSGRRERSAR
jgi:multiple sugar transport system permease protein